MIKRYHLRLFTIFLALFFSFSIAGSARAETFNPHRIIDDSVFDDTNTMGAEQINTFLNQFPNSCISPASGFRAIKPTGYSPSGGYQYGDFASAGEVIHEAAQAYGLNPQVLLVTLQKEQSLVAGGADYCNDGDQHKYAAAVGYGCPDSGTRYNYSGVNLYQRYGTIVTSVGPTCVNSAAKAGFSQQVIRAAWLLKFGQQRSLGNVGWAVIKGSWDNSDDPQSCYSGPMTQGNRQRCPSGATTYYDGLTTIDGQAVHMDSGATAALYWYTPHFHGNENFYTLFTGWFGSTYAPSYGAKFYRQSTYPSLRAGQTTQAFIDYKNIGNSTWYDDTSAPTGHSPVHLATTESINRPSVFSYGWPSAGRPNLTFSKVYEPDGITLAADQHKVTTGQIARFSFPITVPWSMLPGIYREHFQPVLEGSAAWNIGGLAWLDIKVEPTYTASHFNQSFHPTIQQNESANAFLSYKNTGNAPWYDDTSAVSGIKPIHLAASGPINRSSKLSASWPSSGRPGVNFSKVYESDGTTLAGNQHIVNPGQIAQFDFTLTVPMSLAAGNYREYFQPVVEGSSAWNMGGVSWLDIAVKKSTFAAQFHAQSVYPTITPGQSKPAFIAYKNIGGQAWKDDTSISPGMTAVHLAATEPINRKSVFSYSWPSAGRSNVTFTKVYESDGITLAPNQHLVYPGQIAQFDFNFTAPWTIKSGQAREFFQPVLEGAEFWNIGGRAWLDITTP